MKKRQITKPGPDKERLKIDGDWKESVKKAIEKDRPPKGWPKPKKPENDDSAKPSD